MDKQFHERASALFLAACERSTSERDAFLAEACAGDSALLDEVRALLAEQDRLTRFLAAPALGSEFAIAELSRPSARESMSGSSSDSGAASHDDAPLPTRLGSYRVLELLGRGGMGAVYLAEQEHPQRRVALKIVPPGIATPAALRRFAHEAELLGRLQHPGIAQVYEAGTAVTELGPQPFFALELVRGSPLTEHARDKRLDIRARMSLFERVCQAVQHAHNRGVIHRDLKPANILVDESGQPKILDFGVARAIDADVQAGSFATRAGEVVGTLAYMSPEQVEGDRAHIDVRTDVYALGVILYELLAERLPLDLSHGTLAEAARRIREDEPMLLGAHNAALRGDVETIAARALEKDRERRYASAGELAADVQRYLHDEPILARPASTVYQLSKFARRHRGLVTGLAAAFGALVLGIAGTTWQAVRATEERNAALTAKERAQHEAARAKAGFDFITRVLGSPDPSKDGREVKVVDFLQRAEREIDDARGYSTEDRAFLYSMLGATYFGLGLWKETEPVGRKALELMQQGGGDVDANALIAMANLGSALNMLGRYDEAESLLTRAVSDSERVLGPDHDSTLNRMTYLAQLRQNQGRLPEALQYTEQVVMARRRASAENPDGLARALNGLANLKTELGRRDEAEDLYREALALHLQTYGEGQPSELAMYHNGLVACLIARGKLDDADSLIARALESYGDTLGERHPAIVNLMSSRGKLRANQGRFDEACRMLERVVPLQSELLGEAHQETLTSQAVLGIALLQQGKLDQARTLFETMLDSGLRHLRADHEVTLTVKSNYADLLHRKGEDVRAEQLLREVLEIHQPRFGRAAEATMQAELNLANIVAMQGKIAEAESLYLDLLERSDAVLGAGDWRHDLFVLGVGMCRANQGCLESGVSMLLDAFSGFNAHLGLENETTQLCVSHLVQAYELCNEPEKAAEFRDRLLQAQ